MTAAQQLSVEHPRQANVVRVDRLTGDLGDPFDLAVALADHREGALGRVGASRGPLGGPQALLARHHALLVRLAHPLAPSAARSRSRSAARSTASTISV